jgi:3-hydroxyacyl-CoA dehydrogenase
MSTVPGIKNVTVIGGGLMGNGIVQVCACSLATQAKT